MKFLHTGEYGTVNFQHRDETGQSQWVTVMRITYDIGADGALSLKSPQPALNFREQSYGEMGSSPPRLESDIAPKKIKTDVVVLANAYAPGGRATPRFDVGLFIREKDRTPGAQGRLLHERRLRVTGTRYWQYRGALQRSANAIAQLASLNALRLDDWELSEPEPTVEVPLRYDYAYGGTVRLGDELDETGQPRVLAHEANPVGRGYVPTNDELKSEFGLSASQASTLRTEWAKRVERMPAPQIELVDQPLGSIAAPYPLAGWGFVAKHWASRYRHAGTYDAAWEATRHPLLPLDFDPLYWNGAHPDMQFDSLPADCVIEAANLTSMARSATQTVRIQLPGLTPHCHVHDGTSVAPKTFAMRLDTIIVDLLADELTLLYRHNTPDSSSLAYIHLDPGLPRADDDVESHQKGQAHEPA